MANTKQTNPAIPPLPTATSDGLDVRLSFGGSRRGRPPPVPPPSTEGDWEVDSKCRELEETRNRLAQMEKTMRWWSDCTSNWRDKWSKVRTERNRCREEIKQLRSALEISSQKCAQLQRAAQCSHASESAIEVQDTVSSTQPDSVTEHKDSDSLSSEHSDKKAADLPSAASNEHITCAASSELAGTGEVMVGLVEQNHSVVTEKKLLMMGTRLHEAEKTVAAEREEKAGLIKALENFREEMFAIKSECDELKLRNDQSTQQLKAAQDNYESELSRLRGELEEDAATKSSHDYQLAELRKQFEKLEVENAAEWERRERVETDKQKVERENKRLRAEVEQLQAEVVNCDQRVNMTNDNSTQLQELAQKTRELNELKYASMKLKKQLQDAGAEHEHMSSRAVEHEAHVRRLRARIDELKQDLATAQDEVDQQTNLCRRLQRSNDELQQQVDNLQVQLAHLHSRLRGRSPTRHSRRHPPRSCSLQSFDTTSSTTTEAEDEMDGQ